MDSFLRASRSHTRGTGESRDHSLLSSPSFPFITLTLWPRPPPPSRHAMPPGSAITPSAAPVEVQCTARSSPCPRCYIDSTLPIFGLGIIRARNGRSSWVRIINGRASRGPPTNVPYVRLPNRHYYRNKGATASEGAWGRAGRAPPHEQETSKIGLNDGRWPRLARWSVGRSVG